MSKFQSGIRKLEYEGGAYIRKTQQHEY